MKSTYRTIMLSKPTHYSKKPRLTLAQLTAYDDILTDALVDHAYYWTSIRKNKSAYRLSRGLGAEDVPNILRDHVIVKTDTTTAEEKLLALPALSKFMGTLKAEQEKDNFRKHLRKYINIYKPDCPFEVASTNRYTVVTHEASVTARQFIKKGQTIKYLTGIQISLSDEEMESIKSALRDFSIVVSSRKKSTSLFLGPARFANHDCNANARLLTSGRDGMDIVAHKDIQIGDEITVSYGEDYFDEDNSSCLCQTCENQCVNGWTMPAGVGEEKVIPKLSIEESNQHDYKFRQRRPREESSFSERDNSMTPEVHLRPRMNKRTPRTLSRFQSQNSPSESSPSPEIVASPLKRKQDDEQTSPSPSKKARRKPNVKAEPSHLSYSMVANDIPDSPETVSVSPRDSASPGTDVQNATDATSVDEDTIIVQEVKPSSSLLTKLRKTPKTRLPPSKLKSEGPIALGDSTSAQHPVLQDDTSSVLSDLNSEIFDEEESALTTSAKEKKKKKRKVPAPKTDLDHAPSTRYPGDYIMTPRLLSEPQMSYITCLVCEEIFLQKDAYTTRSSCPRCERHSKLYGYRWPKTEPEGPDDEEVRVLDHREINRFVESAVEKSSRKRARSSMVGGGDTPTIREETEQVTEEPEVVVKVTKIKRTYTRRATHVRKEVVEISEKRVKRKYKKRATV